MPTEEAGTNGAPKGEPPKDPAPPKPPVTPTPGAKGGQPGEGTDDKGITLTTAQLSVRLDRAKNQAKSEHEAQLLKLLGVESVEALQERLKEGTEAQQAQMSEQERKDAELVDALAKTQAAEESLKEAQRRAAEAVLASAAMASMAGRFANPAKAFLLLDLAALQPDAQGHVDQDALTSAINKLAEEEPWTLLPAKDQRPTGAPPIGPTNPPGPAGPARDTDEQRRRRYFGGAGEQPFFEGGGVIEAKE